MRTTFINTLTDLAKNDERIIILTGDLGFSVFENFKNEFPDRYINVGISEQNMVGLASGMALRGKKVYVYSIIPFIIMRAFEQIRIDICYQDLDVKLVGVGGGLAYGPAGATHHAIVDLALMRSLPNMNVISPGDPIEAKSAVIQSYNNDKPTYIRLSRNGEPCIHDEKEKVTINNIKRVVEGNKVLILTTGNMLEEGKKIHEILFKNNILIGLYSVHTLKPIDKKTIIEAANKYDFIITLEEHNIIGGLFSSVSEVLMKQNINSFKKLKKVIPYAINDEFSHNVGSQNFIRKSYGIDEKQLVKDIKSLVN